MNHKRNLAVLLASVCALLVLAVSPVLADDSSMSTSDSDDDHMTAQQTSTTDEDSNDGAEDSDTVKGQTELYHKGGLRDLQERRANKARHMLKSIEQRQQTCVKIQKAVNNKLKAFTNHADRHLARFNTIFTKIQNFKTEKNLSPANYDALVATATAKQSTATTAVNALKSLGTTLDCSANDPASMLSTVKDGATDVRDALKDYRKSLKDIVVALAQANKDNTSREDN